MFQTSTQVANRRRLPVAKVLSGLGTGLQERAEMDDGASPARAQGPSLREEAAFARGAAERPRSQINAARGNPSQFMARFNQCPQLTKDLAPAGCHHGRCAGCLAVATSEGYGGNAEPMQLAGPALALHGSDIGSQAWVLRVRGPQAPQLSVDETLLAWLAQAPMAAGKSLMAQAGAGWTLAARSPRAIELNEKIDNY